MGLPFTFIGQFCQCFKADIIFSGVHFLPFAAVFLMQNEIPGKKNSYGILRFSSSRDKAEKIVKDDETIIK